MLDTKAGLETYRASIRACPHLVDGAGCGRLAWVPVIGPNYTRRATQEGPMITDAIELLDRQGAFISRQNGEYLLLALPLFVEALRNEPRIDVILRDMSSEAAQLIAALNIQQNDLADSLRKARAALDELKIARDDSDGSIESDDVADFADAFRAYDALAWPELRPFSRTSHQLEGLARMLSHRAASSMQREAAHVLRSELANLDYEINHLYRSFDIACRNNASVAFERVQNVARALNPFVALDHPEGQGAALRQLEEHHYFFRSMRAFALGESVAGDEVNRVDRVLHGIRADLELVVEELRRRLGTTRSIRAAVDRYKSRAQCYDAPFLRRMASQSPRNAENNLSADLARYLHDQGMNPLTRPIVGGLQPDLLDATTRWTMYVEAKQYRAGNARAYLRKGILQVWDTLGRLQPTPYKVREAFYVVYRLGGPRFVFPEALHFEGVTVFPVLVDIAEPAASGSRQRERPLNFEEADLLPTRASESKHFSNSGRASSPKTAERRNGAGVQPRPASMRSK